MKYTFINEMYLFSVKMTPKQRVFYLIGVYGVTVIFLYNNITTPKRPSHMSLSSSELR